MPNVTPSNPARAPGPWLGTPVRGTLKGALATLVLLLLGMLFWLLIEQFQSTVEYQRQYSAAYSADLADHVNVSMALRAEMALNLLPAQEPPGTLRELRAQVSRMRQSLPSLQSLALLSPEGEVLLDSGGISPDAAFLRDWVKHNQSRTRTDSYYFSNNSDASTLYLLLAKPGSPSGGYWLLRLRPDMLHSLTL